MYLSIGERSKDYFNYYRKNFQDESEKTLLSHDAQRLAAILEGLSDCKDDSQQRSWFLHEDETTITEYLEELISIVVSVCSWLFIMPPPTEGGGQRHYVLGLSVRPSVRQCVSLTLWARYEVS